MHDYLISKGWSEVEIFDLVYDITQDFGFVVDIDANLYLYLTSFTIGKACDILKEFDLSSKDDVYNTTYELLGVGFLEWAKRPECPLNVAEVRKRLPRKAL